MGIGDEDLSSRTDKLLIMPVQTAVLAFFTTKTTIVR